MNRWLKRLLVLLIFISAPFSLFQTSRGADQPKQDQEPDLVIAKYGSISVRSSLPGAEVYVDDIYKGNADRVIESIVVGEHLIACKADDKAVSGTFQIRKNETLRLDARFDEGKLVLLKEMVKSEPENRKEAEKKKPEPAKQEKPKKTVTEPKKAEQKNPIEDRRKTYLNVMSIDYDVPDPQHIKIERGSNLRALSKYSVKKNSTGKYYRTKQGVLLCDTGPCEMTWTATFIYTDENAKADAVLLNWKETVFNGITPSGTSKRELEYCLNGQCQKKQDTSAVDTEQQFEVGRYHVNWTKTSVLIRRSDIVKEILDAGRSLSDY